MKNTISIILVLAIFLIIPSCKDKVKQQDKKTENPLQDPDLKYLTYEPNTKDQVISRSVYADKLYGCLIFSCE